MQTRRAAGRPFAASAELAEQEREVLFRDREDRVEGEVDVRERSLARRRGPVAALAQPIDNCHVTPVLDVGRPLVVGEMLSIAACERELAGIDASERGVEAGRIVGRLPRMHDRDEARVVEAAVALEPAVPRIDPGKHLLEEFAVGIGFVQRPNGSGQHRGLRESARRDTWRARTVRRAPDLRPGRIVGARVVEHDVRHHSVRPPAAKQRAHLPTAALGIDAREAERDERRVPVPLERVDARPGLDEEARVVAFEHIERGADERMDGRHRGSRSAICHASVTNTAKPRQCRRAAIAGRGSPTCVRRSVIGRAPGATSTRTASIRSSRRGP